VVRLNASPFRAAASNSARKTSAWATVRNGRFHVLSLVFQRTLCVGHSAAAVDLGLVHADTVGGVHHAASSWALSQRSRSVQTLDKELPWQDPAPVGRTRESGADFLRQRRNREGAVLEDRRKVHERAVGPERTKRTRASLRTSPARSASDSGRACFRLGDGGPRLDIDPAVINHADPRMSRRVGRSLATRELLGGT
jgi:hypothetical protein